MGWFNKELGFGDKDLEAAMNYMIAVGEIREVTINGKVWLELTAQGKKTLEVHK